MKLYKNIMENVVEMEFKKLLPSLDVCDCDRCQNDIIACSLNQLPPKYIVSDKGILFSSIEMTFNQYEVDVIQAISKAAQIIKNNPCHNKDDVEYLLCESYLNKKGNK